MTRKTATAAASLAIALVALASVHSAQAQDDDPAKSSKEIASVASQMTLDVTAALQMRDTGADASLQHRFAALHETDMIAQIRFVEAGNDRGEDPHRLVLARAE